jgi:DeoR family transcriptional regulator, suf operon transcriptional repressor
MPDALVSPTGLRIVKLLVGAPPKSVADLIRATGVTRTAVTEQLTELLEAGFVERALERKSARGRPRHVYKATNAALALLFPGNQWLLVPALWQAVIDVGGEELSKKILKRVSRAMAEHYRSKITAKKPKDRLRQFLALLSDEGGLFDLVETKSGRWTLHKRSCPFISMADDRRCVCRVDLEMMTAVVGRPVRRTACRHDGAACCTFEIAAD